MSSRRLAAVLFSDIVGYSKQMGEDEDAALALLQVHNRLFREQISASGGREVKTVGDAFMVEFSSGVVAVTCGLEVQKALSLYNDTHPDEEPIRVRIGVHAGDVVDKDGDLFGETVNIAARLEPCAAAGSVCVAQSVVDQVRRKVNATAESLGARQLKNMPEPLVLFVLQPSNERLEWIAQPTSSRRGPVAAAVAVLVTVAIAGAWWMRPQPEVIAEEPPKAEGNRGGTLSVAFQGGWGEYRLYSESITVGNLALELALERLLVIDPNGKALPGAVARWQVHEDGRTIDLWMQDSLSFHPHPCVEEGRAVELEDVAWSLALASERSELEIASAVAHDGMVTVELAEPTPYPLLALSRTWLVPRELADCEFDDIDDLRQPVGTGPFRFQDQLTEDSITLVRNDLYWRRDEQGERLPMLDAVEIWADPDPWDRMLRGDLQLVIGVGLPKLFTDAEPRQLKPELQRAGFRAMTAELLPLHGLLCAVFMNDDPDSAWSDPRVRRALGHAIDRKEVAEHRDGEPADRFLTSGIMGHDAAAVGIGFDIPAAKRLLAEAGYANGKGLPVLRLRGGGKESTRLTANFEAIGVKVEYRQTGMEEQQEMLAERSLDMTYTLLFERRLGADPYAFFSGLTANDEILGDSLADPAFQAALSRAAGTLRRSDRADAYRDVERRMLELAPVIPIVLENFDKPWLYYIASDSLHVPQVDAATGAIADYDSAAVYSRLALRP